jgi:hypothetical protein
MHKIGLLFAMYIVSAAIQASPSVADDFEGWCFPADDCTGEPMPIKHGTFATCEESCEMTNPAKIEGLEATVFDVTCKADHLPEPSHERMIFIHFSGDQELAAVVAEDGITELTKCAP